MNRALFAEANGQSRRVIAWGRLTVWARSGEGWSGTQL